MTQNINNTSIRVEECDMVIQPKAHLLDLNLKEVWRYRDLLLLFVKRDFIAQYKQTIFGPFSHLIQLMFTTDVPVGIREDCQHP